VKRLDGKVGLVTGGGTGTGRAIGLALAAEGCSVVVNYSRSKTEAEETAHDICKTGVRCFAAKADVSSDAEVGDMIGRTTKELGRLDVLVNCAGWTAFIPHKDLEALTDEICGGSSTAAGRRFLRWSSRARGASSTLRA
jgi:3-oxoacyl-[acyl-carrier protein] reductase